MRPAAPPASRGRALSFSDSGRLLRFDAPHRIVSGSIHYFRVHPELWEDRLRRLAATGFNTVDTYVPWNFHEPVEGRPDFTGWRDLEAFVRLAGELGLDVIVRPSPYICAEWTNGGLPAWLTARVRAPRSSEPAYQDAVARWYDDLVPRIAALQAADGGPVVAVQVENEYGSYGDDSAHVRWVHDQLVARGITELLYTADGPTEVMLDAGMLDGVYAAATLGSKPGPARELLAERQPGAPFLVAEYWNGWFDHWGEQHHVRGAESAVETVRQILEVDGSVSVYMAHGGSNFGLWAGANHDGRYIQPTVPSYDSDAPISEDGRVNGKYAPYRELFAAATGRALADLPELPPEPPRLEKASAPLSEGPDLLTSLARGAAPVEAPHPLTFEELGHDSGLVVYSAEVRLPSHDVVVTVRGLRDRAHVYVDGVRVGVLDRDDNRPATLTLPGGPRRTATLTLVVESLGRINYGPLLGEHKGITGAVLLDRRLVHGWTHRPVPVADWTEDDLAGLPHAELEVDAPADGWVAVPGSGKCFVWLNGFLLGPLWDRGPQERLYAPAPLWRAGRNTVTVLELEQAGTAVEVHPDPEFGPVEEYVESLDPVTEDEPEPS